MECVRCGSQSQLDRIVVDNVTKAEVGGLCENCQHPRLKSIFNDVFWHDDSGCVICADPADYHLPQFECLIQFSDDRPAVAEYSIDTATARLCSGHLESILSLDSLEIPAPIESDIHS